MMYSFLKYVLCVCRHLSLNVNPRYKGIDGRFHQKHRQARQSFACIFPPDKPPLHILLQATAGQRRQWQAPSWKELLHGMAHWKPGAAKCVLAFFLPSRVHSLWQQGHSVLLQHGRQSLSPLQKNRVQTPPSATQLTSHIYLINWFDLFISFKPHMNHQI